MAGKKRHGFMPGVIKWDTTYTYVCKPGLSVFGSIKHELIA